MAYQGWTNYETWCVNLWLSNEEPLYRDCLQLAADVIEDDGELSGEDRPDVQRYKLADVLKEYVDDLTEQLHPELRSGASFVTDLLSAALSEVNFYEIAEHWLADAKEVAEYESQRTS